MLDDKPEHQPRPTPDGAATAAISASMLAMLNASITAQVGLMLQVPVNASDIMNLLIEHTAKVLALVEPRALRDGIMHEIRRNLPGVIDRHVAARNTSAGGIVRATELPGRPN